MFTGLLFGRVYLIEDDDGLTLVDTSITSAGSKILKQLTDAGRKPTDVKRILITHAHPDHIGSLPMLKQMTGAQVIASAGEKPVIEGKIPIPRPGKAQLTGLARFMAIPEQMLPPVAVDRVVNDGDQIPEVLGGLTVVATPGHAPAHISLWQPARKLIILGDVLFNAPNLRLPPAIFTYDMAENKRSVGRVARLVPDIVCFGHGEPILNEASQRIRAFARKIGVL
jgi:glyoxylase-like metal-dependent hydrolase (beta-lactamase superfamily II)